MSVPVHRRRRRRGIPGCTEGGRKDPKRNPFSLIPFSHIRAAEGEKEEAEESGQLSQCHFMRLRHSRSVQLMAIYLILLYGNKKKKNQDIETSFFGKLKSTNIYYLRSQPILENPIIAPRFFFSPGDRAISHSRRKKNIRAIHEKEKGKGNCDGVKKEEKSKREWVCVAFILFYEWRRKPDRWRHSRREPPFPFLLHRADNGTQLSCLEIMLTHIPFFPNYGHFKKIMPACAMHSLSMRETAWCCYIFGIVSGEKKYLRHFCILPSLILSPPKWSTKHAYSPPCPTSSSTFYCPH